MNIQEFTQIKENVWNLIKLTGNVSDLKMTFTFISIRESYEKNCCFFIFYPFVSGLEETKKENRGKNLIAFLEIIQNLVIFI